MENNPLQELNKKSYVHHMDALLLASQSYDKALLSLSTALLGFTFAFVKLTKSTWLHACLLPFVWGFLILSIIVLLMSFIIDQIHCGHRIDLLDSRIQNPPPSQNGKILEKHWTDNLLFTLSIVSGIFFVIGIILFTIFVGINI